MDAVVGKPIQMDELLRAMNRVLEGCEAAGAEAELREATPISMVA
jgi:hypothetical protein